MCFVGSHSAAHHAERDGYVAVIAPRDEPAGQTHSPEQPPSEPFTSAHSANHTRTPKADMRLFHSSRMPCWRKTDTAPYASGMFDMKGAHRHNQISAPALLRTIPVSYMLAGHSHAKLFNHRPDIYHRKFGHHRWRRSHTKTSSRNCRA